MSGFLEILLLRARGLPWPGAWGLLQLLAAVGATLWLFGQTRSNPKLGACWLFALPVAVLGAYALGLLYRLPAVLCGRSDDLLGAASFGALAGAALGFGWMARRCGTPLPLALDLIAPALMLLVAIGRLGCFLAGCDAGVPCGGDWAVRFPAGTATHREQLVHGLVLPSDQWSLAVHPAQLYEASAALSLFFVSARLRKDSTRTPGTAFLFTAFGYALARVCIDGVRSFEASVTVGQITALLVLTAVAITCLGFRKRRQGDRRPGTLGAGHYVRRGVARRSGGFAVP